MKHEIKKLLLCRELQIVLLLMLIGAAVAAYRGVDYVVPEMAKHYREKAAQYAGISLLEAREQLAAELDALSGETEGSPRYYERCVVEGLYYSIDRYMERDEQKAQLLQKILSISNSTDYQRRDAELAYRLYNRPIQDMLCNRIELNMVLSETGGSRFSNHRTLLFSGLYLLLVCVLTAPLFSCEYENGMYQILFASKRGCAGLFRRKIICGMITVTVFTVLFTAMLYAVQLYRYGLSVQMLHAPVQCTDALAKCPYLLNIWQYIFLHTGMHLICGWLMLGVSTVFSCFSKRSLTVFAGTAGITALILLPPLADQPAVQRIAKQLGLLRLLFLNDYLEQYDTVNVLGYPVAQITLSVAGTLVLTILLITAAYTLYTREGR